MEDESHNEKLTKEGIIQSCASASISSQVVQPEEMNDTIDTNIEDEGYVIEEERFTSVGFRSAL